MSQLTIVDLPIASPCDALWSEMHGSDTVRHCGDCKKNVYNISLLSKEEIDSLVAEKEGRLCVRYYHRRDGTVITSDCPKGLRKVRLELIKLQLRAAASFAAFIGMLGLSSCSRTNTTVGDMVAPSQNSQIELTGDTVVIPAQTIHTKGRVRLEDSIRTGRAIIEMGETLRSDSIVMGKVAR